MTFGMPMGHPQDGHAAEVAPPARSAADGDGVDLGVVFWDGLGVDDLGGCWRGSMGRS